MPSDAWSTSARIIGELLKSHPEAESLLDEARHCQALAVTSAAGCGGKFREMQAARLGYEELRHRLVPRRGRPLHFAAGMLFLTVLGAGLVLLNWIELTGILPGAESVLLALGAAAVWITVAWLTALAALRHRRDLVCALVCVAVTLGLLLVAWHGSGLSPSRWVLGGLAGAFILVLTGGASALTALIEPAGLLTARRRWHQARADHERAVRVRQADLEAAAIAREAWLSLVETWVTSVAPGDQDVIEETVALATALLTGGSPMLPG